MFLGAALVVSAGLASVLFALNPISKKTWEFDVAGQYIRSAAEVGFGLDANGHTVAQLLKQTSTFTQNSDATFTPSGRENLRWDPAAYLTLNNVAANPISVTEPSLVGLWHLDEGTGQTVADARGVNHGTFGADASVNYNEDPDWNSAGRFGGGVSLEGGFIQLPQMASNQISVEAWVKTPQEGLFSGGGTIFSTFSAGSCGGFPATRYPYQLDLSGGHFRFTTTKAGGACFSPDPPETVTNQSTALGGQWYHVVATSAGQIYVNGILDGTAPASGNSLAFIGSGWTKIGVGSVVVDEVAIYNVVLSAGTIAAHYAAGRPTGEGRYTSSPLDAGVLKTWRTLTWTEPVTSALALGQRVDPATNGLLGLWSFDEGAGTPTADTTCVGSFPACTNSTANPGLLGNPGLWTRQSRMGRSAVRMDQSAPWPITVASTPLSSVSDNWAIEAWVWKEPIALGWLPPVNGSALVFTGTDTRGYGLWRGTAGNDENLISVRYASATAGNPGTFFSTGASYDTNAWTHVVARRSGGQLQVFKNGVLVGGTDLDGAASNPIPASVGDPLTIGRQTFPDGSFKLFNGVIDEVAVYAGVGVMSDAQIATHYQQGALTFGLQARSGPNTTPDAANSGWTGWASPLSTQIAATTPGLVGLYHFDEGTGIALSDTTGLPTNSIANPGVLVGSPFTPVWIGSHLDGVPNDTALRFDGVDDVASVSPSPLFGTAPWTLEAWVYDEGTSTGSTGAAVVYNGSLGTNGYGLWRGNNNTTNQIAVRYGSTCFATGLPYDLKQWTHVAAARDSAGVLKIYKNGQRWTGVDYDGAVDPVAPTGALTIGNQFGGVIDEVAVYSQALTDEDIRGHYEDGRPKYFTSSPQALNPLLAPNQYAQYRAIFSSESAALSPHLQSVTLTGWDYPTNTILWDGNTNPSSLTPFTSLSGFSVTPGAASLALGIEPAKYRLKIIPGITGQQYYYNGATWVTSDKSPTQSNTAAEVQAHIAEFPKQFNADPQYCQKNPPNPPCYVSWASSLVSNGENPADLDMLEISYDNSRFSLTAPSAGTVWSIQGPQTIAWDKLGSVHGIEQVRLEFSPSGIFGADMVVIAATAANVGVGPDGSGNYAFTGPDGACTVSGSGKGCYVWNVPGDLSFLSGTAKVRMKGADAGTDHVMATSNSFAVAQLALVAPAASDVWRVGESRTIRWAASGAVNGTVSLQYASDGDFNGAGVVSITPAPVSLASMSGGCTLNAGESGCYVWTTTGAPASALGQGTIRIQSAVGVTPISNTSAGFTLVRLDVTAPNGTASWPIGTAGHLIQWAASSAVSTVTLTYDQGGTMYPITPGPVAASSGSYSWDLPANAAYISAPGAATVKIAATVNSQLITNTSAGFSVTKPVFTVIAPAAGEVVGISPPTYPITWTSAGGPISNSLVVEYTKDGGTFFQPACAGLQANDGACDWIVLGSAASPNVQIRVRDSVAPFGEGLSPAFTVAGAITLLSPTTAGMKWAAGKSHAIQWTNTGAIPNAVVEFSKTGAGGPFSALGTVATAAPYTTGIFTWTPASGDATTQAVIRISDAANPSRVLKLSPQFVVTTVDVQAPPCPSGRCLVGTIQPIPWTQTGLTDVKLFYSTGGAYTEIDPGTPKPATSGTYAWTVADDVKSSGVTIRIEDGDPAPLTAEQRAEDVSSAFAIYGALELIAHNGGAPDWAVGTPQVIRWTTPTGTIPNVRLEVSGDGFISDITAIGPAPIPNAANGCTLTAGDSGCYRWTPPATGATMLLRVLDAQDPLTKDESNGTFRIIGISVTSPNASSAWTVGSPQTMSWGTVPDVSSNQVKLEYSTNGFSDASQTVTIATGLLNAGTSGNYPWPAVADAIGTNVRIRVSVMDVPGLIGISQAFTITGQLSITTPGSVDVGSDVPITWSAPAGTIAQVTLQYSTDGSTWLPVLNAAGTPATGIANTSPFFWRVPDAISTTAKVRVVDAVPGHPMTMATSNAFTIRAAFAVTDPAVTSAWAVNEVHQITWTTLGTVATVIFEYSVNGGPFTPFGAANNCATPDGLTACSLNWTVPNLVPTPQASPTVSVVVRVKDATPAHPAASADSPAFTVKWYKIIWHVLDSNNNNHLNGLNVQDDPLPASFWPGWLVTDGSLASSAAGTLSHFYPAGNFNTTWSKTGYFSGSASGWAADADKVITVYLESETADQVEYHVHAESAYDASGDALTFKTWLEKRGLLVGTTASDLSKLGGSTIEVYDGTTLLTTLTDAAPDSKGQYEFTWPATGLIGGKVYFATASVAFPNQPAPGVTRTSGGVVNISIPKQIDTLGTATGANSVTLTELQTELQPIATAVTTTIPDAITNTQGAIQGSITTSQTAVEGTVTSTVGAAQTAIQTDVAGVQTTADNVQTDTTAIKTDTTAIKQDTGAIRTDVQTILVPQVNAVKADTTAIKADTTALTADTTQIKADTTAIKADTAAMAPKVSAILSDPNVGLPKVQQMLTDQGTQMQTGFNALRKGALLNRDGAVEQGERPVISYRSEGGAPTLDVYNAAGARLFGPILMGMDPTGLYTFALDTTNYVPGEYKVMVNEPSSPNSQGTIDSIILSVREPALRDPQANTDLSALDTKVDTVLSQLNSLALKADAIQTATDTTKANTDRLTVDLQALSDSWSQSSSAELTQQLASLETKLGSPTQAEDTKSLVGQVTSLQQLLQSSQGSAASVSYAQNAMAAALEAVDLLKQLQSQVGTPGAEGGAAPPQLTLLQETLTRLTKSVTVLPGQMASEDFGKQVVQLTEQLKALASEKGYAFDSLYEMSEVQTGDVRAVRNRVEELKALLDVQQSILENRVNEPVVKTWFEATY